MRNNKDVIKIGLFIDGNYLLHTSNYYNYVHREQRRLSVAGISRFIRKKVAEDNQCTEKECMMTEGHYFRGRLNATDAAQRGNQLYNDRVFDDIMMSEGIHTHYLPLRNLYARKEERGIDVWLSLEAFEKALLKELDYVALVISDTDYVPLVRKLTSLGVKTILIGWEFEYQNEENQKVVTKSSQDLINNSTISINLSKVIEDAYNNDESEEVNDLFINQTLVKDCQEDIREKATEVSIEDAPEQPIKPEEIEVSEILSLKQGYGFIKYPNNNLFFHYHDVEGDFSDLEPDDTIEFVVKKNIEGQDVAKNIKKVSANNHSVSDIEDADDADNINNEETYFDWSSTK